MSLLNWVRRIMARSTQPNQPVQDRVFVPRMNAGVPVTHDTAMQFSAVFRAISYISGMVAMMPWRVYTQQRDRKELTASHPVDRLLHTRPNPEMTSFTFRETLVSWALAWGNGYAEIERDAANRPSALWPISPDRVDVKRIDGRIVYEVSNTSGAKDYLEQDQMYHLHGLGFDGLVGHSVISLAARGIGVGMAAEQFGASFFQNGTVTNLKIEYPEHLGEEGQNNLRNSLKAYMGGPYRAFNPLIVEEGAKISPMSMPMEDAQFLETRQFQVEEIARWFGLPPHKLQSLEKATFSNIEQQSIEVVTDALMPWTIRLEQEADYKLFSRGGFFTKINMNALLRGDLAARKDFYREMWNIGVFSINEIRELEDMNPVPDGDKRFVQLNMTTLEKAGEEPEPAPPPAPAAEPDAEEQAIEEVSAKIARREMHRVQDAAKRYAGNRADFVSWLFAFINEHRTYWCDKFGAIGIDASGLFSMRINQIRQRMLTCFDDAEKYPVLAVAEEIKEVIHGNHQAQRLPDQGSGKDR